MKRPDGYGPNNGHLSDSHRAILTGVIDSADEGTSYRQMAEQFRARTRRRISAQAVRDHLIRVMKRPGLGGGKVGRPRREGRAS